MSHCRLETAQTSKTRLPLAAQYGRFIVVAMAGAIVGLIVGYSASDLPIAKVSVAPSMSECVAEASSLFRRNDASVPEIFRDARDHCYSVIQAHDLFNDSTIRKLNYLQQYRANGILMWMVVVVTFSGVLLAGLQLGASYRLAAAAGTTLEGNGSTLTLNREQLVLKSSITGLFILIISFCFFLVFVFYVYKLEASADRNDNMSPPVAVAPTGGLGPPQESRKP